MSDDDIQSYLEDWAKDYCHDDFEDGLPAGVVLFVDRAIDYIKAQAGTTQETLGDWSVTIATDFPLTLTKLLVPYRRIKTL